MAVTVNEHEFRQLSKATWKVPAGQALKPLGPDLEPATKAGDFRTLSKPSDRKDFVVAQGPAIKPLPLDTTPTQLKFDFRSEDKQTVSLPALKK